MLHWIWVHAGLSSANSPWYLFWSGIGADWTRLLAIGTAFKITQRLTQHHAERLEQQERHHRERMNYKWTSPQSGPPS